MLVLSGADDNAACPLDSVLKTFTMSNCSSSGDIDAVAVSTFDADNTSRDMAGEYQAVCQPGRCRGSLAGPSTIKKRADPRPDILLPRSPLPLSSVSGR